MTETIRNARAASLPAKLSRSWLLVNAAKEETFTEAQISESDSVIFDLEASVSDDKKITARDNVVRALEGGMSAWVRINKMDSEFWDDDLAAIAMLPGLRGVMLPETERPEQVSYTAMRAKAGLPVIALLESAMGVENATKIAEAPGTFRLAFGTNDFRKDTGFSGDPMALAYARSRLTIASRMGGLPGAIDGPSAATASDEQVRNDAEVTHMMGMTGKLVLNVDQVVTLNESMSPSEDERDWARQLLEAAEGGSEITDGSYLPRLARAKKIASLASTYGLWNA
ncbi:MAG: HpcH/HpaI aldolase/citrate lyase family protein [Brevibacterium aurantiacum]|uniref:Citrate lyase subunit beta / citryl-CoA lyase n=1 Tax=Brevibacterium aurantiacum TaxID=273384 RepID=A0A2A3ZTG6_BREAU|nr:CoA ester lyase [Brevibacterium aurantiacum]MDN5549605.1 CoA ester lyase [Brevibacterium sp.]AZL06412.1 CoA ester lyase [Brevibacterium aurantiacum]AZL09970.1 CoA ester lyase [Brevibacterium aurantiacum]AZL13624.1 CoA ester lyase [Brevibacterium aurantiacum]AZT94129.1 CoA ester lyase [Brevibacterium aurantiacum]